MNHPQKAIKFEITHGDVLVHSDCQITIVHICLLIE